jgi:hypothetical protein
MVENFISIRQKGNEMQVQTKWIVYEEPTWEDARQSLANVPELMKNFISEIRPAKLHKRFTKFLGVEWKSWTNLDVLIPVEEYWFYF